MKTMTCKELGGACEEQFSAATFDEIAELAKQHGMQMFMQQDEQHMNAMQKIQAMMQDPVKMQAWMDQKRKEFDNKQED